MDKTVSVRILFFAQAREQTKQSEGNIDFVQRTYKPREILNSILNTFPELKPLEHCVILARNQNYLDFNSEEEIDLKANDEIAVIPPISSGIETINDCAFLFTCSLIRTGNTGIVHMCKKL